MKVATMVALFFRHARLSRPITAAALRVIDVLTGLSRARRHRLALSVGTTLSPLDISPGAAPRRRRHSADHFDTRCYMADFAAIKSAISPSHIDIHYHQKCLLFLDTAFHEIDSDIMQKPAILLLLLISLMRRRLRA